MATHKVVYRSIGFLGERDEAPDLERELRQALSRPNLKGSYRNRTFAVSDAGTKGVINSCDIDPPGVFAELFQLDWRRALSFLEHANDPSPLATVKSRDVPGNEDHLGPAAYFLVMGQHMALIEGLGMRSPQVEAYINALLQASEQLKPTEWWSLAPKVQVEEGTIAVGHGISRLDIVPIARLTGDAPSQVERTGKRRSATKREEKLAHGAKVFELLKVLGASDADLGTVRGRMSTDLGLEARVVITVKKDARGTTAQLDSAAVTQAVASLEETNTVMVKTPDGSQSGRLATLSRTAEIGHDGGLLNLEEAAQALTSALRDWSNRGVIDIDWN